MPARWYRIVAESDPGALVVKDGVAAQGVKLTVPDEVVEQIRAGYQCLECLEPLSESFPENCPLCGFPMKKHQAEMFARVFKGHVPGARTGPDWDAQADALEERAEMRARRRRIERAGMVTPQIIVPRGVDA